MRYGEMSPGLEHYTFHYVKKASDKNLGANFCDFCYTFSCYFFVAYLFQQDIL